MTDVLIREYTETDVLALVSLWTDIFGDSETFAGLFFEHLPKLGTCMVAEKDGAICGMASILPYRWSNGTETDPVSEPLSFGYLYGVAVRPELRGKGIGTAVSQAAVQYARNNHTGYICTLPADAGLYAMYEKTIGTVYRLKRRKIEHLRKPVSEAPLPLLPAGPEHFLAARQNLLGNTPHILLSEDQIRFLKALCIEGGGDIYASCDGLPFAAAFTREGDTLTFSELLCAEEDRELLLDSFLTVMDAEKAVCYLPSRTGEDYLAHDCPCLAVDSLWELTFD